MLGEFELVFPVVGDVARGHMGMFNGLGSLGKGGLFGGLRYFVQGLLDTFVMKFGLVVLFEGRGKVIVGGRTFGFDPAIIVEVRSEGVPGKVAGFLDFVLFTLSARFVLVAFPQIVLRVLLIELDLYVTVAVWVGLHLVIFADLFSRQRLGRLFRT